jgi:hypothetical protein
VGGVALVQFDSQARFQHDDLVLMSRALYTLLEASPLAGWAPAASGPVSGALKWLLDVMGVVAPPPVGGVLRTSWGSAASSADAALGKSFVIDLATEEVLDHAAALLDASVLLHRGGLHTHAFALEGIQGRLLEATVGAGSVERR